MDWYKIIYHGAYVTALAFFSTLSVGLADNILSAQDFLLASSSAFVAGGLAAVSAWGVQQGEPQHAVSDVTGKRIKGLSRFIFL